MSQLSFTWQHDEKGKARHLPDRESQHGCQWYGLLTNGPTIVPHSSPISCHFTCLHASFIHCRSPHPHAVQITIQTSGNAHRSLTLAFSWTCSNTVHEVSIPPCTGEILSRLQNRHGEAKCIANVCNFVADPTFCPCTITFFSFGYKKTIPAALHHALQPDAG